MLIFYLLISAGDHLIHSCPTWSWAKASDPKRLNKYFFVQIIVIFKIHRVRDYLPAEKQFLITRQVPCHQRCSQMMGYDITNQKVWFGFIPKNYLQKFF